MVPESGAIPVPDAIPFDRACLIGCGVMTGVGAVLNIAAAKVGDSAVILGCGAVGLNAIQGARLAGCDPIIAVDVAPEKLTIAERFGATVTLDARTADVAARVKDLIPTVIDQNPCAHLRMPRDMIFHGWSMRLFQAWQHSATMSS